MSKKKNDEMIGKTIFNKYKLERKLGEGSFGKIYTAVNITTGEYFALKMEAKDAGQSLLETEAYILCYLKGHGIPSVKSYGFSGEQNVLVMELLGKSLEDLFQENNKKLSIETTCMIAIQMLDRIEFVHNKSIIHRDIKPDNFVIGRDDNEYVVYLLDFGLSKKYKSSRTNQHIKLTMNKKLTGTARYASINALKGFEQSRRDDLEAIGYVLMYFIRGSLPWQGLQVDKREDRYKKIGDKKKNTTAEELCNSFPREFYDYVTYSRNLEFEAVPDYEYLRNLFRKVLKDKHRDIDYFYDWCKHAPNLIKTSTIKSDNKQNNTSTHDNFNTIATVPNVLVTNPNVNVGHRNENLNTQNAIYDMPIQTNALTEENKYSKQNIKTQEANNDKKNTDKQKKQPNKQEKNKENISKGKGQDESGKCIIY